MELTQKDLELLYAACMSYGNKLLEMAKNVPDEEEFVSGLVDKAKEYWNLAKKITRYMED